MQPVPSPLLRRLAAILAAHPRVTDAALAAMLGLAPSTAHALRSGDLRSA